MAHPAHQSPGGGEHRLANHWAGDLPRRELGPATERPPRPAPPGQPGRYRAAKTISHDAECYP